ncbi:MAG: hypothetical protein HQ592_00510 [Planctomycetes bacterium]|nr:hypothetical protein [Planctomycetota bacterium]
MKKKLMLAMVAWGCISCGIFTWACGPLCEWLDDDYHCECGADPSFVQRDARQPHAIAVLSNALEALDAIEPTESHPQAMSKARDSLALEISGEFHEAATLFADAASKRSSIELAKFADGGVARNLTKSPDKEQAYAFLKSLLERGESFPGSMRLLSEVAYARGELEISLDALVLSAK